MKEKFIPITEKEKYNIYGGFNPSLVVMIPMIIEGAISLISSIKMFGTENASFQYNKFKSSWSNNKPPATKTAKNVVHENYYSF